MNFIHRCVNRIAGTVVRVRTIEPLVALTFDDGPDPEGTPALLERLAAHGAKATFFMIGMRAAKHPQLVEAVHRAGHAIGNHTWDHPSLPLVSRVERRRQLLRTAEILPRQGRMLFRPPYGHFDAASQMDVFLCAGQAVAWSDIIPDWEGRPAAELAELAQQALRPGAILAMHDGLVDFMNPAWRDRRPMLEAVETLLSENAGRYEFVTLPELMRRGKPVRACWRMTPDIQMLNRIENADANPRRYGRKPSIIPPSAP